MKLFNNIKTFLILILLLSLIGCNKTDWKENFNEKSKSPFGTYIVYNEAEALFNNEVVYLKQNIYDHLLSDVDRDNFGNYICIKSDAYRLDLDTFNYLLHFIKKGNNAFISLNSFDTHIEDSLQFKTKNLDLIDLLPEELKQLKGKLYLENPNFKKQSFEFDRNIRKTYFESYNKNNTVVLGTIDIEGVKQPNFIKVHYGKGSIFLHTNPVAFTNFFMLNGNQDYAGHVFSYLPSNKILWDPQRKSSSHYNRERAETDSIFIFFLKHSSLKWFLLVSILGLLLFMLFNARRKQRAIPIIKPLQNSTKEFAHTIANLYLKERDHKNLVDKKTTYFLEKVRTKYLIDTSNLNSQFIKNLAAKSNNKLSSTKYLINTIIALNKKTECSDVELMVLNKMIENFFKK